MPGFNGTGPQGLGPMTGGGRGYCVTRFFQGSGVRRGRGSFRRGYGRGRGRGCRGCNGPERGRYGHFAAEQR